MNEKFILALFDKFEKGSSVSLHIKDGEMEFSLQKAAVFQQQAPVLPVHQEAVPPVQIQVSQAAGQAAPEQTPHGIETKEADSPTEQLITVKSPIVGSFYRSPSPDAPAYVEKGSKVSKGQPLCILEAMKMMNTLESEYDGTIQDILAANGDLVAFDQPLFIIRR